MCETLPLRKLKNRNRNCIVLTLSHRKNDYKKNSRLTPAACFFLRRPGHGSSSSKSSFRCVFQILLCASVPAVRISDLFHPERILFRREQIRAIKQQVYAAFIERMKNLHKIYNREAANRHPRRQGQSCSGGRASACKLPESGG
jgi:hypothetical protein